jgi:hypothetical protein
MKFVFGLFLILAAGAVVAAQPVTDTSDSSKVTVVKFSWSKERVGWEGDPFSGPIENFDEMRVRARNEKRIGDAKRGGNGAEVGRAERDARTDDALIKAIHQSPRARYGFIYKVSVRNNSDKVIKTIDWDYVFIDRNAQMEIGRRQFGSSQKISPGKTKDLQFFITTPPTKTISVTSLRQDERKSLDESVVVVRVEYEDGTFWQRP